MQLQTLRHVNQVWLIGLLCQYCGWHGIWWSLLDWHPKSVIVQRYPITVGDECVQRCLGRVSHPEIFNVDQSG